MNRHFVIAVSGGHLKGERFVHSSGLLIEGASEAERFTLIEATKLIKLNLPETKCKMVARYKPLNK
jgi:hypothetical protein